jgi:2-oxo-4-hydroxy-4-carboxy-5-ureidoimidazoline decarboxylase
LVLITIILDRRATLRDFRPAKAALMNVNQINAWTDHVAGEAFRHCCGSVRWSELMAKMRPFDCEAALYEAADRIWWGLGHADWLEAFAAHPKIGDLAALRAKFAATAWAAREQAAVIGASDDLLRELAEENHRYEDRFGYIFIVCATGKTADEMLALLKARLGNDAGDEIKVAAGEQAKITRIRLEKLAP